VYLVRYSYLATIGASSNLSYQFSRLPAPSGMWSTWTCCRGPDGIYFLGRDGIYRATDQGVVNITDERLYPLFPHDGQAALGTPDLAPVDMTQFYKLRLSCADYELFFDYIDTNGVPQTFRYEIRTRSWWPHNYEDDIVMHYLVELSVPNPGQMQLLLLSRALGFIYLAGGTLDNTAHISCIVQTPSYDGGDERGQKLYIDQMTDVDGRGLIPATPGVLGAEVQFNNQAVVLPQVSFFPTGPRTQFLQAISSIAGGLALYRNISVRYSWFGGPGGIRLFAFEPSGYAQPYVSNFIATQYINLGFPGWKHHRRLYAGLISNNPVEFTIQTQDGRTFVMEIPSTSGQFRIMPLMVPQNCKDLAFAYQLDGQDNQFALFPEAFTIETKEWNQPSYIELAPYKT
jgi:hypothetical protein